MNRTALFAFLALVALPAPALAHAHLQGTKPASGARLTIAPRDLTLTFSEAPTLAMSALRLLGPDSTSIALGTLGHAGGARTLTASITGPLVAGTYTVLWQTAGDDGHVQHGSYQFVIADGAEGIAAAVAKTGELRRDSASLPDVTVLDSTVSPRAAGGFDVSSPIYVAIRWLQFVALLVLIGAVAFRWWILPRAGVALDEPARRDLSAGVARAGLFAAWFLAISALARLAAQVATTRTASSVGDAPSLSGMLLRSEWGHGWLLEIVALSFAIACLRAARREATVVFPWRITAAATVGLAFVPALSGHAVADRMFAPFTVLFDGAHVLAAGAWLGTLAVMIVVGLPIARRAMNGGAREALVTMVNAFSPLALTCAGILVLTGIVAARVHVGSWAAFTNTSYGRTLLIKLALVLLLVVVATWNWRRVKPTLMDGDSSAEHLRHSATLELLFGVLVVAVTAVLVALPTPVEMIR